MKNNNESDSIFNDTLEITGQKETGKCWKVVIADDDKQVHSSTRIVLNDLVFDDKKVVFLSAYSAQELKEVLISNPDTAVILLDVVMENFSAGLDIVKVIREELNNKNIRIILRTGQPGHAPEKKVIMDYDINDYREKSELTSQKLFTAVYSALKAYKDIRSINSSREAVQYILDASDNFLKIRSAENLAEKSLDFVNKLSILIDSDNIAENSFSALIDNDKIDILSKKGNLTNIQNITDCCPEVQEKIREYRKLNNNYFQDSDSSYLISPAQFKKHLIYLKDFIPSSFDEKQMLTLLNKKIGLAFENLFLNNEIINTQIELIHVLGEIIENRSHETAYHVTRVSKITEILLKTLNYKEDEIDIYSHASPLHDVGKIGISDAILLKPGKLNDQEFNIIKAHTTIGYKLLSGSSKKLLKTAAVIALQHHEKWNGKGYPEGLKGKEINRVSRIISIADVFDALSNDRVYKKAWETGKTLQYIEDEKGKSFDPEIVECFFHNIEEIIALNTIYKD